MNVALKVIGGCSLLGGGAFLAHRLGVSDMWTTEGRAHAAPSTDQPVSATPPAAGAARPPVPAPAADIDVSEPARVAEPVVHEGDFVGYVTIDPDGPGGRFAGTAALHVERAFSTHSSAVLGSADVALDQAREAARQVSRSRGGENVAIVSTETGGPRTVAYDVVTLDLGVSASFADDVRQAPSEPNSSRRDQVRTRIVEVGSVDDGFASAATAIASSTSPYR